MKRTLFGMLAVAVASGSVACNPFAPDQSVILHVERLDAPATISAGSPLPVVLTVTVGGCTSFDHIGAVRGASGATMIAWGRNSAKGRKNVACPQDSRSEPHSYQFEPPIQSPFTIQVEQGTLAPPLTATVLVQ